MKLSQINKFNDEEGRVVEEWSPLEGGTKKYVVYITLVFPSGAQDVPVEIKDAKNIADAFTKHDETVTKATADIKSKMQKAKLAMPASPRELRTASSKEQSLIL